MTQQRITIETSDKLTSALAEGFGWLDLEQPDDAIQRAGITTVLGPPDRRICLAIYPHSARGGEAVAAFELVDPERDPATLDLVHPLEAAEVDILRAAVQAVRPIVDSWNGIGGPTVSFGVDASVHPSLDAAIKRYLAGCPEHNTVFCGNKRGCRWLVEGSRRVLRPPGWW